MKMNHITDVFTSNTAKKVNETVAGLLAKTDLLMKKAAEGGTDEDKKAALDAKEECQEAIGTLMIVRSVSDVWSGIPICKVDQEPGVVYGIMGEDAPNRSGFIMDDGGVMYVAGGDRKGSEVFFHTFSTSLSNAETMMRSWIVRGRIPTDIEKEKK